MRLGIRHPLARFARDWLQRDWPVILLYHQVARVTHDPWQLAVSPERFADQIEALGQARRLVPLGWLAEQLAQGRLPHKVAAVTFDDGYLGVLTEAAPVLQKYNCPATVFVVSGAVGRRAFWWDELSQLMFATARLPAELELEIAGHRHHWRIGDRPADTGNGGPPLVTRNDLHRALWELLQPLADVVRREKLSELTRWAGSEIAVEPDHRPMAAGEVRRLAATELVEIGAHTVTHPVLRVLETPAQRAEITESRVQCEALIGRPVRAFAYPFGNLDDRAVAAARDAGFAAACTTVRGRVSVRCDPLRLPRVNIGNVTGEELTRTLMMSK